MQCTCLRRSERETIRDGDHSWGYCGTNVGPSIMRRNDIESLQTEVKDAVNGSGYGNEEVRRTLGESCSECSGNVRRGTRRLVCIS